MNHEFQISYSYQYFSGCKIRTFLMRRAIYNYLKIMWSINAVVLIDLAKTCKVNQTMELLPHRALRSTSAMYNYLKDKLKSAKQTSDLIPFINILSNIDDLKNLL